MKLLGLYVVSTRLYRVVPGVLGGYVSACMRMDVWYLLKGTRVLKLVRDTVLSRCDP